MKYNDDSLAARLPHKLHSNGQQAQAQQSRLLFEYTAKTSDDVLFGYGTANSGGLPFEFTENRRRNYGFL